MKVVLAETVTPVNPGFFYGWVIVLISALGIFFSSPGQTYGVSIFIDSFIFEFDWSRSFVSSLYSSATLCAGFLLFLVGRLIDRRGHRIMLSAIAVCFSLALFWMSLVMNPLMLFVGFFMIRLLGQGSMALIASTLTLQWFVKNRGKAMSLAALGGVIGSALTPPLNAWMIENLGWRGGWQVWGLLMLFVMAPVSYVFVRNRPESVGLTPDNRENLGTGSVQPQEESWTLARAKRTRSFWLLLFCMFVPSMVNTGITFHFVSIMAERGLTPTQGASVLGVMALVALPSTFLAGYVLDRVASQRVLFFSFAAQVMGGLWLIYIGSLPTALLFGVIRGITQGFESMSINIIWPSYFGRKHLGSLRGFAMTSMIIGSAFGPLPFGFAYDLFGGYSQILWIMLLFPGLALLASWLAHPPVRAKRIQQCKGVAK